MQSELNKKLVNPKTRNEALIEIGEWVKNTCLMFGVSPNISFKVSGIFVEGIAQEVTPNKKLYPTQKAGG